MNELLHIAQHNLSSPMILCFLLGWIAAVIRSDLEFPEALSKALSLYLLFVIGFKGGVSLVSQSDLAAAALTMLVAVALSFALPWLAFALLRLTTRLDSRGCAAVAAHYGSISIVTLVTAMQFLQDKQYPYEGYIAAVAAVMETPAIVAGLIIAARFAKPESSSEAVVLGTGKLIRKILSHSSLVLLLGAFVIGLLSGERGMHSIEGFVHGGFKGALCFFLLDMGLVAARTFVGFRVLNWPVWLFALYMPLIGGGIGLLCGHWVGLSLGGKVLFAVLGASASYIAVPAAMRMAMPRVPPSLYLTLALAVTFPFNVIIGIPLYLYLGQQL